MENSWRGWAIRSLVSITVVHRPIWRALFSEETAQFDNPKMRPHLPVFPAYHMHDRRPSCGRLRMPYTVTTKVLGKGWASARQAPEHEWKKRPTILYTSARFERLVMLPSEQSTDSAIATLLPLALMNAALPTTRTICCFSSPLHAKVVHLSVVTCPSSACSDPMFPPYVDATATLRSGKVWNGSFIKLITPSSHRRGVLNINPISRT